MWITRERYDTFIRAECTADYLRVRVNQLETENGQLRFNLTGQPQVVTQLANRPARTPQGIGSAFVHPDLVKDPNAPGLGVQDFEDLGDVGARNEGITVDAEGRVSF